MLTIISFNFLISEQFTVLYELKLVMITFWVIKVRFQKKSQSK